MSLRSLTHLPSVLRALRTSAPDRKVQLVRLGHELVQLDHERGQALDQLPAVHRPLPGAGMEAAMSLRTSRPLRS
jgi:hypothetical protein